jgi:hypothetical protein
VEALRGTIREQQQIFLRERAQLPKKILKTGIVGAAFFGLISGCTFAGVSTSDILELGPRLSASLRGGAVSGSCAAIPGGLWPLLTSHLQPIEQRLAVRCAAARASAAGETDSVGTDEVSKIAREALATVSPERLVQDLREAVRKVGPHNRSWSAILISQAQDGLKSAIVTGGLLSAWLWGHNIASGTPLLPPLVGIPAGCAGGVARFIVGSLCESVFPTRRSGNLIFTITEEPVHNALELLEARGIGQSELKSTLDSLYSERSDIEKMINFKLFGQPF